MSSTFNKEVILPAWEDKERENEIFGEEIKTSGLTRQDIIKKHFKVYGRNLPETQLRREIIPLLEASGLIAQEPDPTDKRKILIYPLTRNRDKGVG